MLLQFGRQWLVSGRCDHREDNSQWRPIHCPVFQFPPHQFCCSGGCQGSQGREKEDFSKANCCVYLHCRLILRHSLLCHTLVYPYPLFVSCSLSSSSLVFGKFNTVSCFLIMDVDILYRKKLFIAVHNFVHLNLAISLLVGYLVFALGVELAASNKVCQSTFQYPTTLSWLS